MSDYYKPVVYSDAGKNSLLNNKILKNIEFNLNLFNNFSYIAINLSDIFDKTNIFVIIEYRYKTYVNGVKGKIFLLPIDPHFGTTPMLRMVKPDNIYVVKIF